MKKVLILAYDFPPHRSIAALRPASWLKYFKKFDLFPVVLTLHWDNDIRNARQYSIPSFKNEVSDEITESGRTIRVPFKANHRDRLFYKYGDKFSISRKILSLFFLFARYANLSLDSTREIFHVADELLARENFDCILITAEPFILFKYGHLLSQKHNIPWIADYRDCWSNSTAKEYLGLENKLINAFFYKKLEQKYVGTANLITCPSPSYEKLISRVNDNNIKVVYNGFDLDGANGLKERKQNKDSFEIAYAGRIYPHQNLEVFLEGYLKFIDKYKVYNTRAIFYGLDFYPENKKRVNGFNKRLNPFIDTTPRIAYEKLLNALSNANLLLLLSNENADWLNAKIFDYLPLNRKILLTTTDHGVLQNLISETRSGVGVQNSDEVCEFLYNSYLEFKSKGEVSSTSENYQNYSREHQASVLSKLIHQCVA